MKPKKSVLFVSHQADFMYGGETATLSLMRGLKERGWEVHFASPSGPFFEAASEVASRSHLISSIQFSRKLHFLPRLLPALWRTKRELKEIVKKEKIAVVHATSLKSMVYCWRLRKRGFPPIVWHQQDILAPSARNNIWLQNLAKSAASIVVASEAARRELEKAHVRTRIDVIHYGYTPSEWTQKTFMKRDPFVVGMVGEISKRKGSDLLPGVLRTLESKLGANRSREVEIRVIGEGLSDPEFAKKVKEECRPFMEGGRIQFLGRIFPVKDAFQELDLLIVPSREEAFGLVVLEAMFSGIPVIGAPVGGILELISEGETGYFAVTAEEIAEKILVYKNDFTRLMQHGGKARKRAETHFSLEHSIERLATTYLSLLS